jgi:hypothetical protein
LISGAALVTSTVLYLQARRGRDRTARLLPALAPTTAGLVLVGAF